jgi:hypothetical protein
MVGQIGTGVRKDMLPITSTHTVAPQTKQVKVYPEIRQVHPCQWGFSDGCDNTGRASFVAFSANWGGDFEIYTVEEVGTGVTRE